MMRAVRDNSMSLRFFFASCYFHLFTVSDITRKRVKGNTHDPFPAAKVNSKKYHSKTHILNFSLEINVTFSDKHNGLVLANAINQSTCIAIRENVERNAGAGVQSGRRDSLSDSTRNSCDRLFDFFSSSVR